MDRQTSAEEMAKSIFGDGPHVHIPPRKRADWA